MTAILSFRSASIFLSSGESFPNPLIIALHAIKTWAMGTPIFLKTVESVKSRCSLDTGNFSARKPKIALAIIKLPSAFSKSIGLTLWGIAEEPTSLATAFCLM